MAEIVGWKQLGPVEGSSEGNEGVKSKGVLPKARFL